MPQTIKLEVSDAQAAAWRIMGKDDKVADIFQAAINSRTKGAIKTYRDGNKMRDANGDVVKINGVEQYKGGLKQQAGAAYDMVTASCKLPISKVDFITAQLKEVDSIIAQLDTKNESASDEEVDE